jgi:hypothetical protein
LQQAGGIFAEIILKYDIMYNRLKNSKICQSILILGGLVLGTAPVFSQNPRLDSLVGVATSKIESAHTVPSFTEMKRRLKIAQTGTPSNGAVDTLEMSINNLKASDMPYNIVVNIYQDPQTKMAFNWFTNENVTGGKVEIVQGIAADYSAFASPLQTVNANTKPVVNLNYNVSANNLVAEAGFSGNNLKKSYTENKVVVSGLTPATTYSFRVGKAGAWSEIGTFTTAEASKNPFTFLYTADPQANTYEMFDISQKTTHAAFNRYSSFNLWLHTGDLVETSGGTNSEWEWEQLIETQQDLFLKTPFAPTQGNHDVSTNLNFRKHFNTEDSVIATDGTGSTYTYIYGDAQFFCINSELYSNATYTNALINWMRSEVAARPDIKWRFVYYHKTIYTGSGSHQSDADGRTWREKMAPIFDELGIDIAFQGHDHIYEVVGPINYNGMLTANAVSNVNPVPVHARENVKGQLNGIFNTQNGTLYFLNNSSGKKKYEPRTESQMNSAFSAHGITNYFDLFTGRFGQTGNPTYSRVSISTDTILISTYEVFDNGLDALFDEFKVVKTLSRKQSLLYRAYNLVENDYTVPSFTEVKRHLKSVENYPDSADLLNNLETALTHLKTNNMPYNIVVTINEDPTTKMGFNWFTNDGFAGDSLIIVQGHHTNNPNAFNNPLLKLAAVCAPTGNLPYAHNRNNLNAVAGIPDGATRSYTEHKALATGLMPNTAYSFRVGKSGAWSEIGTFTTAKTNKESFSFIYTTDPQANTYEMFDVSQQTTHAAFNAFPNVNFWLHCGDLIESAGNPNSEWEWEQLFETQQDLFLNIPFAPVIGNHDNSANQNFTKHFNTQRLSWDNGATTPGSSYSYVYGDALFIAINSEEYNRPAYTDSLTMWIKREVAAHSDVKWRIVYYHKTIYTGSSAHQSDADGKAWRDIMAPVFDSLGIDIAFQGHDHIYEVVGPINYNGMLTADAVVDVNTVPVHPRENVTGRLNGVFNTQNGTLYFLNNSAGVKKYEPRDRNEMDNAIGAHGITNYFDLFTGRFGQTGNPTFSNVSVSTDSIVITTYEVMGDGSTAVFDKFTMVKYDSVSVISVSSISLDKESLVLLVDSSATLTATILPDSADNKNVIWSSSNPAIATVTNGTVRGISTGLTVITATTEDGGLAAYCAVNVTSHTGISDFIATQAEIKIYPNPASDVLTIEADQIINEVLFYNTYGQLIRTVPATKTKVNINTESLTAGVYMVVVRLENGVLVRKVVVE